MLGFSKTEKENKRLEGQFKGAGLDKQTTKAYMALMKGMESNDKQEFVTSVLDLDLSNEALMKSASVMKGMEVGDRKSVVGQIQDLQNVLLHAIEGTRVDSLDSPEAQKEKQEEKLISKGTSVDDVKYALSKDTKLLYVPQEVLDNGDDIASYVVMHTVMDNQEKMAGVNQMFNMLLRVTKIEPERQKELEEYKEATKPKTPEPVEKEGGTGHVPTNPKFPDIPQGIVTNMKHKLGYSPSDVKDNDKPEPTPKRPKTDEQQHQR
jgi:hypothetical protein